MKYFLLISFFLTISFPRISFASHCSTCIANRDDCEFAFSGGECAWSEEGISCTDISPVDGLTHEEKIETPQCGLDFATSPSGGTCGPGEICTGNLVNPLSGKSGGVVNTTELVGRVVQWIFGIIGAIALLMFIVGGTYWLVSFGNETRITKGRQILIWTSVGLLLIFSSYAIINYVISSLVG